MAEQQKDIHALFRNLSESPVYNDAGRPNGTFSQEGLNWAKGNLKSLIGAVAHGATETYRSAFPDTEMLQQYVGLTAMRVVGLASVLTMGKANKNALNSYGQIVAGMYLPNMLVDSGGALADRTMTVIDSLSHKVRRNERVASDDPLEQAVAWPINNVEAVALPEDQFYILHGVYGQILRREVGMRRFSNGYVEAEDKPGFIKRHAKKIAEISSISAGAQAVADGVYGLIRREEPDLPSLADVGKNEPIQSFRRVLNTVARLWDDLGDCEKDNMGVDGGPDAGKFSINVFNQVRPALIEAYLDYGEIKGVRKEKLSDAIREFAQEKDTSRKEELRSHIMQSLTDHMREYTDYTSKNAPGFEEYITMCKRVATIAHVNAVGDDNMSAEV